MKRQSALDDMVLSKLISLMMMVRTTVSNKSLTVGLLRNSKIENYLCKMKGDIIIGMS